MNIDKPQPQVIAEPLEPRRLLAAQLLTPITNTSGDPSGTQTTVNLSQFFTDTDHSFLQFTTELGSYRVELFDAQKPVTVKNFLAYVTKHRLDNTLIHRVDILDGSDQAAPNPITTPAKIVQGGGFSFPGFNQIKTSKPIVNEASVNGVISNARGMIAMARPPSGPNTATSEWFVNVTDNPELDPGGSSGPDGFAVFGQVLPEDMPVVDAIAAVPRFNFDNGSGTTPFTRLPLRNYTAADFNNGTIPGPNSVVSTSSVSVIPDVLNYSVSSSDPTLVNPSISNGNLLLNYGSGTGSAEITVTATAQDGTTATSTFNAGVGQLRVLVGGPGNARSVSVPDADGTVSTISMKGAGTAAILLKGSGITQVDRKGRVAIAGSNIVIDTVAMTGTDGSTALAISSKGGSVGGTDVGGISADGAVRSISAKGVTITRGMATTGAAGAVTIAGATGASIDLGGDFAVGPVTLSLGALSDTGVVVISAVKLLKLTSALNSDATADPIMIGAMEKASIAGDFAEPLTASGISSLSIGGNLTGNISVEGIAKFSVRGNMTNASITAQLSSADVPEDPSTHNNPQNLAMGLLSVGGAITNSVLRTLGNVTSISAGSISGSLISVGSMFLGALPTVISDLASTATLNVLKVKGALASTSVFARFIGKVSVGVLQTADAGTPFGFAADTIGSLGGKTDSGQKFAMKNADTQAQADAALSGVTLGDAIVRLL